MNKQDRLSRVGQNGENEAMDFGFDPLIDLIFLRYDRSPSTRGTLIITVYHT
jgi:hypothetical protein